MMPRRASVTLAFNRRCCYSVAKSFIDLRIDNHSRLAYRWQAGEHLRITPSLIYSDQSNWQIEYPGRYSYYDLQRWHFDVNGVYKLSADSNILAGITTYREKHRQVSRYKPPTLFKGGEHTMQDYAV
jgi:hypothetical protein